MPNFHCPFCQNEIESLDFHDRSTTYGHAYIQDDGSLDDQEVDDHEDDGEAEWHCPQCGAEVEPEVFEQQANQQTPVPPLPNPQNNSMAWEEITRAYFSNLRTSPDGTCGTYTINLNPNFGPDPAPSAPAENLFLETPIVETPPIFRHFFTRTMTPKTELNVLFCAKCHELIQTNQAHPHPSNEGLGFVCENCLDSA